MIYQLRYTVSDCLQQVGGLQPYDSLNDIGTGVAEVSFVCFLVCYGNV